MKTAINFLFAICMLLFCSWACNNYDKNAQQDSESTTNSSIEPCKTEHSKLKDYEIADTIAVPEIKAYEEYYEGLKEKLPTTESEHLIKGVKVENILELYEIVCNMISTDGTLYIMQAIKPDPNNPTEVITDMIFVVKPGSSLAATEGSGNTYFDFTSPCPTSCPF